MLTISQYQILNSCCNDAEIFYFLFAEVNYGGQLFHRSEGRDYAQYVEDREFAVYADYTCQTFEEHLDRYGYGPHEFQVTELGLKEMDKPVYHEYDAQLGYPE